MREEAEAAARGLKGAGGGRAQRGAGMKRATITAISLLLITLAGCAQASGETSEWEKFREWAEEKTRAKAEAQKQEPMPAICRNIEKHHPSKQELMEELCDKIPFARIYEGRDCGFIISYLLADTARDIASVEGETSETELRLLSRFDRRYLVQIFHLCRQAHRMKLLFEWLRKNK